MLFVARDAGMRKILIELFKVDGRMFLHSPACQDCVHFGCPAWLQY